MREEIYRLLSPPERGTPRYRAIAAVKEVSNWLIITLGIILVARACGAFNPDPGSAGHYLILALILVFTARFVRACGMAPEEVGWNWEKGRPRHLAATAGPHLGRRDAPARTEAEPVATGRSTERHEAPIQPERPHRTDAASQSHHQISLAFRRPPLRHYPVHRGPGHQIRGASLGCTQSPRRASSESKRNPSPCSFRCGLRQRNC